MYGSLKVLFVYGSKFDCLKLILIIIIAPLKRESFIHWLTCEPLTIINYSNMCGSISGFSMFYRPICQQLYNDTHLYWEPVISAETREYSFCVSVPFPLMTKLPDLLPPCAFSLGGCFLFFESFPLVLAYVYALNWFACFLLEASDIALKIPSHTEWSLFGMRQTDRVPLFPTWVYSFPSTTSQENCLFPMFLTLARKIRWLYSQMSFFYAILWTIFSGYIYLIL